MKKEKKYIRGSYKKDPNKELKKHSFDLKGDKDFMIKLQELADIKGIDRTKVLRQLVYEEHLKYYRDF